MVWDNYRADPLLCTMYKILANIISKISTLCRRNNGEYQGGFQRGRSTVDQIFTMRQILEKCWEQNIDIRYPFIDLQAAYDTIEKVSMV
jgi:hypothetical protein